MSAFFAILAAIFFMLYIAERDIRKIHEESSEYWYNRSRKWMKDFFKLYKKQKELQQPKKK